MILLAINFFSFASAPTGGIATHPVTPPIRTKREIIPMAHEFKVGDHASYASAMETE
jgi:hypothetical protein